MSEAYICRGVRTPIGRFGGVLSSVRPDDLLASTIRAATEHSGKLELSDIDDVIIGCANQAGEDNRNIARMALLISGLPPDVPAITINRLCGSGLNAIGMAASSIRSGEAEIILAGGVESMSRAPLVLPKPETAFSRKAEIFDTTIGWRFINPIIKNLYGIDSMPETAENVAEDFSISREDQDLFAFRSQEKAALAIASGRLAHEIIPINLGGKSPEVISKDEHPRKADLEKLGQLSTPFKKDGTVTAGNASGVNDGAAALIIASRNAVEKYQLEPFAKILGMATAGVEPRIMGIGPVPATKKLLERLSLKISDFDIIEINEAFAAQSLAVMRQLGLKDNSDFVNPNGGAIALGHPLGMSGARLALTSALELKLSGLNRALCTMCIGVGQGISLAIEKVN